MKKVSSIALALLFAASAFAYEQIGQLNPYAYGVSGTAKNNKIAVAYSLNSPADSTIIAIYRDGEEVGTQVVADNAPGLHSAVVDIAAFGTAGTYTVGVRVYGKSYDKPTQLREIKDGSTDTTALCYAFYHPKGVEIDRNPFSEYFGRILTDECMQDTPDQGYHSSAASDKDGIYAFDATFQPITNGNNRAFKGGICLTLTASTSPVSTAVWTFAAKARTSRSSCSTLLLMVLPMQWVGNSPSLPTSSVLLPLGTARLPRLTH